MGGGGGGGGSAPSVTNSLTLNALAGTGGVSHVTLNTDTAGVIQSIAGTGSTVLTIDGNPSAGAVTSVQLQDVNSQNSTQTFTGLATLNVGLNGNAEIDMGNLPATAVTTTTSTQAGVASGSITPFFGGGIHNNLDLSAYTSSLNLTNIPDLTVVNGQLIYNDTAHSNGPWTITLPTLVSNQTITLDTAQVQGGALTLTTANGATGAGLVLVGHGGPAYSPTPDPLSGVDLSGIASNVAVSLSLDGGTDLSDASLSPNITTTLARLSGILLNGNNLIADVNSIRSTLSIAGSGNITIDGTVAGSTAPNLGALAVTSGHTVDLTGISGTVILPTAVNTGETLLVNDNQFTGTTQTLANNGTLTIVSTGGTIAPDFSGITTATGATAVYSIVNTGTPTTITQAAVLGTVQIELAQGVALTIDAFALNGHSVDAASGAWPTGLTVTDPPVPNTVLDLSHIGSGLQWVDLTQVTLLSSDTLLLPATIASGQVFTLNAAEMTGQTIAVSGQLTVSAGQGTAQTFGGIDFSNVSGSGTIALDVGANATIEAANLGSASVHLSAGSILDNAIFGTATIHVDGNATITGTVAGIANATINVGNAASLGLSVDAASGATIGGAGTVFLTGTPSAAVDLSHITALANWVVPSGGVTLPIGSALGSVVVEIPTSATLASQNTLTLQASAASGAHVQNLGSGAVLGQIDLTSTYTNQIDLSHVQSNISLAGAAMSTASGQIGFGTMPTLASGQQLAVTASQLLATSAATGTALTVAGAGIVNVTGALNSSGTLIVNAAGTIDLTHLAASVTPTFGTNNTVSLAKGDVLAMNAASAGSVHVVTNASLSSGNAPTVALGGTLGSANIDLAGMAIGTAVSGSTPGLTVDLSGISDLTGFSVNYNTFAGSSAGTITVPSLASGNVLILGSAVVAGTPVQMTGTGGTLEIRLASTALTSYTDLSHIAGPIGVAFITTAGAALPSPQVSGATLVLAAGQAAGRSVTSATANGADTGTVMVVYNSDGTLGTTGALNLANLATNIDLTGLWDMAVSNGTLTDGHGGTVALPTLAATQTVTIGATSLTGGALALTGTGTLNVQGDIARSVNLGHLADGLSVAFSGYAGAHVQVGTASAAATLTMKAGQASGLAIISGVNGGADTGTVALVDMADGGLDGSVLLTNISANIDLTALAGLTVNTDGRLVDGTGAVYLPSLGATQTLTVTSGDLSANPLALSGTGTLNVTGDIAHDANLGQIGDGLSVVFSGDTGAHVMVGTSSTPATLTMKAGQASGQTIISGVNAGADTGTLAVVAMSSGNLGGAIALGQIATNIDLTALSSTTVNSAGLLADTTGAITLPTLTAAQTVLAAAANLTGHALAVAGAGTLNVENDIAANVDLTGLADTVVVHFSADSGAHVTVGTASANATLTMKAVQLSGQTILSAVNSGADTGTVKVAYNTDGTLDTSGALDLSHVAANIDLTGLTNLSTPSGVLTDSGGGTITLPAFVAGQSLSMGVDQLLDGAPAIGASSGGTLNVVGNYNQNIDLTALGDAFQLAFNGGTGATISGAELTVKAAQLSGLHLASTQAQGVDTGTVVLADNGSGVLGGALDLSHVATNIDFTQLQGLVVTSGGLLSDASGGTISLGTLAASQVMTMTYAQANNFANNIDFGAATAIITLIAGDNSADLSHVFATGGQVIADVETAQTFTGNFGQAAVNILNAVTLTTAGALVNGRQVYGVTPGGAAGLLLITRDTGSVLGENLDLSGVSTSIDVQALSGLVTATSQANALSDGTHSVSFGPLVAGQTLYVTAAEMAGALDLTHATGVTTSRIDITGNPTMGSTVDLRGIQSDIAMSFVDSASDTHSSIQLDESTLLMKVGQASGQTISMLVPNGGTASSLVLYDNDTGSLDATIDLSHVTADVDLTNLANLHVVAGQFSDGTGSIAFGTLAANQAITVNAGELANATTADKLILTGAAGSQVNVSGSFAQSTDLSGIADAVLVNLPSTVLIGNGATLTLKAEQAVTTVAGQIVSLDFGNLSSAGNGTVKLADNDTGHLSYVTNLTNVTTNIDLTLLAGLMIDSAVSLGALTDNHGIVLLPSLATGQSLTLDGSQIRGGLVGPGQNAGLNLAGTGTLNVEGNVTAGNPVNLTSVAPTISVNISGLYSAQLQLTAAQLNGNHIQTDATGRIVVESINAAQGLTVAELHTDRIGALLPVTGNVYDTAANIAAAIANSGGGANLADLQAVLTADGATIKASTAATAAQAAIIDGSSLTVSFAVADTAAGLAASSDAVLSHATAVIATTPATIGQAITLDGFANSHVVYSLTDSAANIAAAVAAATSAATVNSAIVDAQNVVITGSATFAQAAELANLSAITGYAEADTAADFQTALTGGSLASLVANAASVTVQLNADGTGMTALAAESLLSSGLLTGKYVDIQTVTTDITDFEADFGATGSAQHLVTAVPSGVQGFSLVETNASSTTSTTSLQIGGGSKTLTIGTGLAQSYTVGETVEIADGVGNSMTGTVQSYTASNGHLVVNVNYTTGSGTFANWTVINPQSVFDYNTARNFENSGSHPGTYSLSNFSDTAQNVINAGSYYLSKVNGYITVTNGATVAQAITLAQLEQQTGKQILWSVYDSAADIAALQGWSGWYSGGTNSFETRWNGNAYIQDGDNYFGDYPDLPNFVPGAFNVTDTINGIVGAANAAAGARIATMAANYPNTVFNFSVVDTVANILNNFTNALLSHVTGQVVATGTVTAAQAVELLSFTKAFVYSISDTIQNIEAALTSTSGSKTFLSNATNITVTNTVTAQQALDVTSGVTNTGVTTLASMNDTATNIAALSPSVTQLVAGAIVAMATGGEDLSHIQGNIDLTNVAGQGTDSSGNIRFSATSAVVGNQTTTTTYTVALPATMATGRTLSVTTAEIAGTHGITLGGTGAAINIQTDIAKSIDLRGVGTGVAVNFRDGAETGLGTAALAAGASLIAYSDQITGQSLTGASNVSANYGTVVVHGRGTVTNGLEALAASTGAIDISHITANIDLSNLDLTVNSQGVLSDANGYIDSTGANGALVLQNNQTVFLSQGELIGSNQLSVSGAGAIDIEGNLTGSVDLRYLATNTQLTLSFYDAGDATKNDAGSKGVVDISGTQSSPITVTMTPTQANGIATTGTYSTILLEANPSVAGTALSASVDLARVASTLPLSATAWAAGLVNTNNNGSITANANGSFTITGTNTDSTNTQYIYTATSYGIVTFNITVQSNNYGENSYYPGWTSGFGTGTQILYNANYSQDNLGVNGPNSGWGVNLDQGGIASGTFTTTMTPGQTVYFYINNGGSRATGLNAAETAADTMTISVNSQGSGGFSAYGGNGTQTLQVDVAGSGSTTGSNTTDLTSAADPVAYTSVSNFVLSANAVLEMTPLEATNKLITSPDGTGSVLINGNFNWGYFYDLTTISVPVNFVNNTINSNTNPGAWFNIAQVNGVASNGQYWIYISNLVPNGDMIDLTQLGQNSYNNYWHTFSGTASGSNSTGDNFVLGAGAGLILNTTQANGRTVTNANDSTPGTVYIVGNIAANSSLNTLNINQAVQLSFQDGVQNVLVAPNGGSVTEGALVTRTAESGTNGVFNLGGSSNLYIYATQVSNQDITGNGTNTVYVYGNLPTGSTEANLTQITTSIDLENLTYNGQGGSAYTVADPTLTGFDDLYMALPTSPNADQLLTLSGGEAGNLHLEFGNGQVLVENVQQLVQNGAISANFTQIHASVVTLEFSQGNGVIHYSGAFGVDHLLLDRGTQLVMAGSVASGVVMDGRYSGGSIGITGMTGTVDLTQTTYATTLPLGSINDWVDISLAYGDANSTSLSGNAIAFNNADGYFEDSAGDKVLLPTFAGQTLEATFSQLNGGAGSNSLIDPIAADRTSGTGGLVGTGDLVIDGSITQNVDLTTWSPTFAVYFSATNNFQATYYREYYGNYFNQFTDTIADGVTVKLRANQTYAGYLTKLNNYSTASVQVIGGFDTSSVYLDGVTANIDLTQLGGSNVYVAYNNGYWDYLMGGVYQNWIYDATGGHWVVLNPNLAVGQTLTVLTDQISGTAGLTINAGSPVSGHTAMLIAHGDFDSNTNANALNVTGIGSNVAIEINYSNGLSHLNLGTAGTLYIRLDQSSGFAVTGTGTIDFSNGMGNLGSATHVDLTAITASLNLTGASELTLSNSVQSGSVLQASGASHKYVSLPTLISGQSVDLNLSQIGYGELTLNGAAGSTLVLGGNLTSGMGAINLLGIASAITVEFNPTVSGGITSSSLTLTNNTMTMTPTQATGLSVQSSTQFQAISGNVVLVGALAANTDLSAIGANIDLTQVTGITVNSSNQFGDASGNQIDNNYNNNNWALVGYQKLSVLSSQMVGNALYLGGSVHSVLDIEGNTAASIDLTQVGDNISISFADANDSNSINSGNQITLTSGAVLTMKGAQASGQYILGAGTGTLVLVDDSLAQNLLGTHGLTVDLSHVTADINLAGLAGVAYNTVTSKFGDANASITLPTLASGQTLWVAANELVGAPAINGAAGSKLYIEGDVTSGNVDISGVSTNVTVEFVNSAGAARTVLVSGATLTVSAAELAAGVNFSSGTSSGSYTGTIAVKDNPGASGHLTANLDLSGVAANLDLSALTHVGVSAGVLTDGSDTISLPVLATGQTLSLASTELAGGTINLATSTGGILNIEGDLANSVDLSNVGDNVTISFSHDAGSNVSINGVYTLTVKAAAITGRTVTTTQTALGADKGTVVIADMSTGVLGSAIDLSHIAANIDLTQLAGLAINGSGVLQETASGNTVTLGTLTAGQTLTVAANLLTGNAFALAGVTGSALNVTGNLNHAGTINLTSVGSAVTITFNGGTGLDLSQTGALEIASPLASGITVTSTDHTGTVDLVGALGGAVNLASISANIDLSALSGVTVNSTGKLADSTGAITLGTLASGQTLFATGAELTGHALALTGSGTLSIEGVMNSSVDLSGLGDGVTVAFSHFAPLANTFLGTATQAATLTIKAAQLSGLSIASGVDTNGNDTGTIVLIDSADHTIGGPDYLGYISTNIDVTQLTGLTVNGSGYLADSNGYLFVTALASGETLFATAAELTGGALTMPGTGTVNIAGDIAASVDLSMLDDGMTVAFSHDAGAHVMVGTASAAATLTIKSGQITGQTVGSAQNSSNVDTGTVAVVDMAITHTLGGNINLANIAANIDLTQLRNLSVNGSGNLADGSGAITLPTLQSGQTLDVAVDAVAGVSGLALSGQTGSMLNVTGTAAANDLVNLTALQGVAVEFGGGAGIALTTGDVIDLNITNAGGLVVSSNGGGTVVLEGAPAASVSLGTIGASVDLTQLSGVAIDSSHNLAIGSDEITFGTTGAAQTVSVLATQLTGSALTLAGTGTLNVEGAISNSINLAGLGDSMVVSIASQIGTNGNDATLTIKADAVSGQTITSALDGSQLNTGTLALVDMADGHIDHAIDLSGISANIDLTALAGVTANTGGTLADGTGAITLPTLTTGQTLLVTATEMAGHAAAIAGLGTVNIAGDIASSVDLSALGDGVAVVFSQDTGANVQVGTSTADATLTIKSMQLSGQTILSGVNAGVDTGTVVVVDNATGGSLYGTTDLSNVAANIDVTHLGLLFVDGNGILADGPGSLTLPTLQSGQTLTATATELTGATGLALTGVAGSTLAVTGDLATGDTLDLSNVTGAAIHFADAHGASIAVTNSSTLVVSAAEATGINATSDATGTKTGTVRIINVNGGTLAPTGANLGGISANIDLTNLAVTVNASGLFTDGTGTIDAMALVAGQTLTVNSSELAGSGAIDLSASTGGTLAIDGTIAADTDLTHVASSVALQFASGVDVENATLTMTGAQATGLTVTTGQNYNQDTGTVALGGAISGAVHLENVAANIDLTHVAVTAGTTANTFVDGNGDVISIGSFGAGQNLVVTAAEADGLILTGAGTLVLENDGNGNALTSNVSLAGVTTNIDLTNMQGIGVYGGDLGDGSGHALSIPTLQTGQQLLVTAGELGNGNGLTVLGSGSLVITGDIVSAVALRDVAASVELVFANSVENVGGGLDVRSDQANGLSLTGSGHVDIEVNTSTPGPFDLSHDAVADTTVWFSTSATFDSNTNLGLASTTVAVGTGQTLTSAASVLSTHTVNGLYGGELVLTGNADGLTLNGLLNVTTLDVTQITAGSTDNGMIGASDIFQTTSAHAYGVATVIDGQTFDLTAAQLSGNAIVEGGMSLTGNANVLHGDVTVAYDFSYQTAFTGSGAAILTFDNSGTMAATTDLQGFNAVNLASGTTTMTAAQANGITWGADTAGGVNIVDATTGHSGYTLTGTNFADTFTGNGHGDLIDMSQGKPAGTYDPSTDIGTAAATDTVPGDTLVFSGSANDFIVDGFTIAQDGTGDTLNFSALDTTMHHTAGTNYVVHDIQLFDANTYTAAALGNDEVLVFSDFATSGASAVAAAFNTNGTHSINNHLATALNGTTGAAELILIEDGSGNTDVYLWRDNGSHHVTAGTLTELAVLHGVNYEQLGSLTSSHIIG